MAYVIYVATFVSFAYRIGYFVIIMVINSVTDRNLFRLELCIHEHVPSFKMPFIMVYGVILNIYMK